MQDDHQNEGKKGIKAAAAARPTFSKDKDRFLLRPPGGRGVHAGQGGRAPYQNVAEEAGVVFGILDSTVDPVGRGISISIKRLPDF